MNVDDNQEIASSTSKLYSQNALFVGGCLFGFLAFGYLSYRNLKILKQDDLAKKIALFVPVGFLLVAAVAVFVEVVLNFTIPQPVYFGANIGLVYAVYQATLKDRMIEHKNKSGGYISGWRAFGVMVLTLVCTLMVFFGSLWLVERLQGNNLSLVETVQLVAASPDFDGELYDKRVAEYTANEDEALRVYDIVGTGTDDQIKQLLLAGRILWDKNLVIATELETMEGQPEFIQNKTQILREYTILRLEQYNHILDDEDPQSAEHSARLDDIYSQIDEKLELLAE